MDRLRYPVCFQIILEEIFFELSDSDEPGLDWTIDQRLVTSPAERIAMFDS